MSTQYRVYVTPLYSAYTYNPEIEISDYVENVAGTITQSIDSTDFSVGIFTYNDVQLTCDNSSGVLSDQSDSRSIFPYSRDRAKVRIVFDQGDGSPTTTYRGVINDSATVVNSDTDEIQFTLLGPDSILTSSIIQAGNIPSGSWTVKQALNAILGSVDISSVLGIYYSNINPSLNFVIDDGTKFDNLNKKDALTSLLAASNSVALLDSNLNLIIRDREQNQTEPILFLYGKGDQYGRENIISIQNYNTGLQRVFNSVIVKGGQQSATVGGTSGVALSALTGNSNNAPSIALYGLRQKSFTMDFVQQQSTLNSISQNYTDEFSSPKIELEVTVPTSLVANNVLLDLVSVNYPLLITPSGKFLPVIGITEVGDTNSPIPYSKGAISIDPGLGFKIIEKTEDISTYQTTLKLRQIGAGSTDGRLDYLETEAGDYLETESGLTILGES